MIIFEILISIANTLTLTSPLGSLIRGEKVPLDLSTLMLIACILFSIAFSIKKQWFVVFWNISISLVWILTILKNIN